MEESQGGLFSRLPTAVPGQYLGYSLQASRMLDHLLNGGPGVVASLEVLGDTAVTDRDGTTRVEELKSRTTRANPIADRAIDFWKTIRNWVDAVRAGHLDPRSTRFTLYVTQSFEGHIANRFSYAHSRDDAIEALDEARERLFASEDPVAEGSQLNSHLQVVFSGDIEATIAVIRGFELQFGSGRSWNDLRASIESSFVPPDCLEGVLRGMSGWISERINANIEQGEPAAILWDDFREAIIALVRRFDQRQMLASVARQPDASAVARELEVRTYVRQLRLIDLEHDECLRAVTDYLLAEANRVEWARRGTVLSDSFDELEGELIASWRNFKRRCDLVYPGHSAIARGQLLYLDCCQHRVRLGPSEPPDHFCRGSFHKLSEAAVIGWHPEYSQLLRPPEAEE
jgi:hypothetical protein